MVSAKIFNTDGITRVFTVDFTIETESHARVYLDSIEVDVADYDVVNNSIVFTIAPTAGQVLLVEVATNLDEFGATPTEASIITANIDDIRSVATNISAILSAVGIRDLDVSYLQLDNTSAGYIQYSALNSTLVIAVPEGRPGEKGDTPIITMNLDGDGNLSYEVTYTNATADGIGVY